MRRSAIVALLLAAACAPRARSQTAATPADSSRPVSATDSSRSYGTLSQSDLSLRLVNDELEIRFTPLAERVTRLLAPDAYQSLRGLRASRQMSIDSVARVNGLSEPGLALVTFYGQRDGVRFDPDLLTVVSRGRFLRPVGVVPLTPGFTAHQLAQRGQATGILLYDDVIPVDESFTLTYDTLTSDDWERKLPVLERERGRVSARMNR
ncbi:MAG TPA: hypothetical protein VJ847_09175 [Gemmatimonadales bacterium]|jgi:hypothetical protein|nr:hypothetical protein [Gemmatimonadales bacterium]